MSNIVIIGTQWGDEGKGKIVDLLAEHVDGVVRFQGGHNAGHTPVIDGVTYKIDVTQPPRYDKDGNLVTQDQPCFSVGGGHRIKRIDR